MAATTPSCTVSNGCNAQITVCCDILVPASFQIPTLADVFEAVNVALDESGLTCCVEDCNASVTIPNPCNGQPMNCTVTLQRVRVVGCLQMAVSAFPVTTRSCAPCNAAAVSTTLAVPVDETACFLCPGMSLECACAPPFIGSCSLEGVQVVTTPSCLNHVVSLHFALGLINRCGLVDLSGSVACSVTAPEATVPINIALVNCAGGVVASLPSELTPADPSAPFQFPNICPGKYSVDVRCCNACGPLIGSSGEPVLYNSSAADIQVTVECFTCVPSIELNVIARCNEPDQKLPLSVLQLVDCNGKLLEERQPVGHPSSAIFSGLCPGTYTLLLRCDRSGFFPYGQVTGTFTSSATVEVFGDCTACA